MPDRKDLEKQADAMELQYENERPKRERQIKEELEKSIASADRKMKLVNLLRRRPEFTKLGGTGNKELGHFPLIVDTELNSRWELTTAKEDGYILIEFLMLLLPERDITDAELEALCTELNAVGIAVTESFPDDTGSVGNKTEWPYEDERQLISMSAEEITAEIIQRNKRTIWNDNWCQDREDWIRKQMSIKHGPLEGVHKCPTCNSYGVTFKATIFYD